MEQIRVDPVADDTDCDPEYGIDETQQWLLPSALRAHGCDDHDNRGCYCRGHYVATST
jgi:hypothetical protein